MKELNGFNKFIVYWGCGCLVSLQAIKEIGSKSENKNECILCKTVVQNPSDIINLNMTDDEKASRYKQLLNENSK